MIKKNQAIAAVIFFVFATAAALRSVEINVDVLLKATKVNGVYSSDPFKNKNAVFFKRMSYMDVLNKGLKIMDSTAITLCMENKLPIIVFNFIKEGNLRDIVAGRDIGTLIR